MKITFLFVHRIRILNLQRCLFKVPIWNNHRNFILQIGQSRDTRKSDRKHCAWKYFHSFCFVNGNKETSLSSVHHDHNPTRGSQQICSLKYVFHKWFLSGWENSKLHSKSFHYLYQLLRLIVLSNTVTCFALCSIKSWRTGTVECVHSVCTGPVVLTRMTCTVVDICFKGIRYKVNNWSYTVEQWKINKL